MVYILINYDPWIFEVQMAGTVSLKFPTLIALAQTEFPPDYVRGDVVLVGGYWQTYHWT